MRKIFGLAGGFVLAASSFTNAQVPQPVPAQVPQPATITTAPATVAETAQVPGGPMQVRRVSQLIGSNVHLQGTNNYGKVEDVVLNENGTPGYLVVANNNKYAMLPWNAARINYGQRTVHYNVTPQAIQPLFFGANAWPTVTDQQFTNRINQVFPNTGVVRREVLRPVEGTAPGFAPAPTPGTVTTEKIKPNGTVKIQQQPQP